MISDSLHADTNLALGALPGIIAGMVGACGMLLVVSLPAAHAPLGAWAAMVGLGTIVTGGGIAAGLGAGPAGVATHIVVGAVLGLLYAVSQQRIPADGLLLVGAFYGFVIWLTSGIVARAAAFAEIRGLIHAPAWLIACIVYGLCLALAALWSARLTPAEDYPQALMD